MTPTDPDGRPCWLTWTTRLAGARMNTTFHPGTEFVAVIDGYRWGCVFHYAVEIPGRHRVKVVAHRAGATATIELVPTQIAGVTRIPWGAAA